MNFGKLPRNSFRPPRPNRGGAFRPSKEPERPLTGKVQNLKASDNEELFSRMLNKSIGKRIVSRYEFRTTTAKRGSVFYKELDFLCFTTTGRVLAIMFTEASFVHKSAGSKAQDKLNQIHILQKLREKGYNVREITVILNSEVESQEQADKMGKKLGLYR